MELILNIPLFLYNGIVVLWWEFQTLPWPGPDRLFQGVISSFVSYQILKGPKRWERHYRKDKKKRKKQAASSTSLFG